MCSSVEHKIPEAENENLDYIRPAIMGEEFKLSIKVLKRNRALRVDNLNGELLVALGKTGNVLINIYSVFLKLCLTSGFYDTQMVFPKCEEYRIIS